MKVYGSVDRIEQDTIIIETENGVVEYSKSMILNAKEGDIVVIDNDGKLYIDEDETNKRRLKMLEKFKKLASK